MGYFTIMDLYDRGRIASLVEGNANQTGILEHSVCCAVLLVIDATFHYLLSEFRFGFDFVVFDKNK